MAGKKVLIIGAGLAGLSLATELADEGFEVQVLEKNYYLGGRASDLVDRKMHDPVPIGPHVFAQSYNNFWAFLRKIGAHRRISWERNIFIEIIHRGLHYKWRFYNLPAPIFIVPWAIQYPFISRRDKLSNIKFIFYAWLASEEKIQSLDNLDAYTYLTKKGVSKKAIDMFWRFVVLSLLNIPLEHCSAAEFIFLLKKWARLHRRKFGFSTVGLGDVYTDEASRYIRSKGGSLHVRTQVTSIAFTDGRIDHVVVEDNGHTRTVTADIYISTLNPVQLADLLKNTTATGLFDNVKQFKPVPYLSVNLWFDKKISRKQFWAMLDDPNDPKYLNTDFYDLSNIYLPHKDSSFIASNIINRPNADLLSDKEIIDQTLKEIREVFPLMSANLVHSHIHRIPYVIYAPRPGLRAHKVGPRTTFENFYLAGDWTVKEPQCMEAAVRSGYRCAEAILEDNGIHKKICDDRVY